MKPIILTTCGIENTSRNLIQNYCYKTYSEAIGIAGGIPLIASDDHEIEELADLADGLYLTGGDDVDASWYQGDPDYCSHVDPWRDSLEIRLIRAFIRRKKPIFGICRGMQLMNVALGGTLYEDLRVKSRRNHPYPGTHLVNAESGSCLEQFFGSTFKVNSFHHQALNRLGDGLKVIARTEDDIIEAVTHETLPILGVQWHPERMTGDDPYTPVGPDMRPVFEYFVNQCRKADSDLL